MVNDSKCEYGPRVVSGGTNRKSSKAIKLVQAAALAAVLVPLGSVAVETSPITHNFSGGNGGPVVSDQVFDFTDYRFELSFNDLASFADFFVTVDNQTTNQGAVTSRLGNFPGFVCVPIGPGPNGCVDFVITGAPADRDSLWSTFDIFISWNALTDGAFPNSPGDRIRILHDEGASINNAFDSDITTPGTYENDPAIGGRDDNFRSFMVLQAPTDPVPEPATLFLVTTGVSGLLYRRRRKRQDSEGR
jgi:hypothetical protein